MAQPGIAPCADGHILLIIMSPWRAAQDSRGRIAYDVANVLEVRPPWCLLGSFPLGLGGEPEPVLASRDAKNVT